MKLTLILVGVFSMAVQASTLAQTVNLNARNTAIESVFNEIKKQTGYRFIYEEGLLSQAKNVNLRANNVQLADALRQLFDDQPLTYQIHDGTVVVKRKPATTTSMVYRQETVKGVVYDEASTPLEGVSVRVVGKPTTAITSAEGAFQIMALRGDSLEFSHIGYETVRHLVTGVTLTVNMQLNADNSLEEVAVVAFGTQKKVSVVGSQATVRPSELKQPVRNLTNALGGRLAGLVSVQRSGEPGFDDASIFIRGVSTFNSSPRTPLMVVDGVPDRSISNIDPEDIESFTILKDASATAVYGTRGANGVIIVNTKKGRDGKPLITVEYNEARTKFTQLPEFIDAVDYMKLYNEGRQLRGLSTTFTDEGIQNYVNQTDPDLYPNIDWLDEIFEDYGANRRLNLSMRGGSPAVTYYVSAGYYNEQGMIVKDTEQTFNASQALNRFNFTSNVNVNLTKTTKLDLGINGFIVNSNFPAPPPNRDDTQSAGSILFYYATKVAPHRIPTRYSNGLWPKEPGTFASPLMFATQSGYGEEYRNTTRSNLRLTQELDFLVEGLSFTSMFAFDAYAATGLYRRRTLPTYYIDWNNGGRDADGNLLTVLATDGQTTLDYSSAKSTNRRFYTESAFNYNNSFGDHYVSGMLLFNQSDYVNGDATSIEGAIAFRNRGLVGRATYGYQDKYFLEGNFGYTGSENFTPENRFGFFPSVGAGWVVSNEGFFENAKDVINHLKLRYSYGLSGNSNVDDRFLFLDQMDSGDGYTYGQVGSTIGYGGWNEALIGNDVTWETSYRHNLGLEINTLGNDLQLVAEVFKERREGILIRDKTVPYASGFTDSNLPYSNVGITENKGVDVSLTYNKSFGNESFIMFNGNFNYNVNRNIYDGLPPWQYPWLDRQGHSIDQRFGLLALGLFESEQEVAASPQQSGDVRAGDIKYADVNGDGLINAYDEVAIGYGAVPRILYGLNFGFGYKGFDLGLFFQGAGQVDFMYNTYSNDLLEATQPFSQGPTYGSFYTTMLDRWTPDSGNDRPFYPRLSTNSTLTTNYNSNSWWVYRADYLRLKSAELGYNFGPSTFQKYGVSKMRFYVNGTNLLTWSRWKVWDPELGDGRGAAYPNTSNYNIGVRVTFN
ncbi:TonB-dependent receptor [Parapedobacter sp. DT-150]|uniref:TonB-dependent receptor n=1 Tax=Parapedobacter sp. DT-150 TaxID=3396162 RepID=UPI003F1DBA24